MSEGVIDLNALAGLQARCFPTVRRSRKERIQGDENFVRPIGTKDPTTVAVGDQILDGLAIAASEDGQPRGHSLDDARPHSSAKVGNTKMPQSP